MILLKQSTAVDLLIGPFLDETDGKTAETGLTVTQAEVRLSKNGGNMAQKGEATSLSHDELGYYVCKLNTDDTDTLGRLKIMVHESGALPVWENCMVMPPNVYDSLFSTDKLQVDTVEYSNSSLDLTSTMKASVDTECDEALTNYDPPTKAEMDSDFAGLNDLSAAEANAECDQALADYDPPTKTELDSGLAGLNDVSAAEVNAECDQALSDYDAPTKAELDSGLAGLNDPRVDDIADAVWDEPIADHITVTTFGGKNQKVVPSETANDYKSDVSGLATAANLQTVDDNVDAILEDTGATLYGKLNTVDTVVDAIKVETDKLNNMIEADGEDFRYTENALEQAPAGGGGGDATAENQTTIIGHLTDLKGTGFVKDTDSMVDLAHIGADGDTLETLSDQLDGIGNQAGTGAIEIVYTLTDDDTGDPIADADVWVTSDAEGSNVLGSGRTDQYGKVTFYLDSGTVYVWRQKSGWNFDNPDTEVVS